MTVCVGGGGVGGGGEVGGGGGGGGWGGGGPHCVDCDISAKGAVYFHKTLISSSRTGSSKHHELYYPNTHICSCGHQCKRECHLLLVDNLI